MSTGAKVATWTGLGGGAVLAGIDIGRTWKKIPEAFRASRFDQSLGMGGRLPLVAEMTAATRPDARLIDPQAPRVATVASLGKSFTKWDEVAMKSSVLLGSSLAGLSVATSIPSLRDALSKDGPWHENLAATTSGRSGVLQLGTGLLGLGLFKVALNQTATQAAKNVGPETSIAQRMMNRVVTAGRAPIMANPLWTRIGIAGGLALVTNALGYFDALNADEERSTGRTLLDAAHKTPVVNDGSFRTAALLTGAGFVGFKATSNIRAAGLSAVGKGPLIGGAIIGGLLGAQWLGKLDALDKK